jgi:hypothetical protein
VKGFSSDGEEAKFSGQWKNTWISEPTSFKTEIPDFAGLGKTVVLTRTLTSSSEIEAGVTVYDGEKVVLETASWFKKLSDEPPVPDETGAEPPLIPSEELRTRSMVNDLCASLRSMLRRLWGAPAPPPTATTGARN